MVYSQRAERLDDKWARRPTVSATAPERWTRGHVSRRMLDAFRIDSRLPRAAGPRAPGAAHPTVYYDRAERDEWEAVDLDPDRFAPSAAERKTANDVFDWLRLVDGEDLRLALRDWLAAESRGLSHQTTCRKSGRLLVTFLHHKDAALDLIAARLNAQKISVF